MNALAPSSPIQSALVLKKSTVADMLDCSIDTIDRLIKDRKLSTVSLASTRSVRVTMESVENFIKPKPRAGENNNKT